VHLSFSASRKLPAACSNLSGIPESAPQQCSSFSDVPESLPHQCGKPVNQFINIFSFILQNLPK